MPISALPRTIFRLSGEGVREWLDGLITNNLLNEHTFAALLTPQGKIIADFFIQADGGDDDSLVLETAEKFGAHLFKRLKMYRMRAPIEITDISDSHTVYAIWGGEGEAGMADPRQPALGYRLITQDTLETTGDYNAHRLSLGIPDSAEDFETASVFPADACMDQINGVDFKKGCFIGQEVVSRMKRMTTVKKRMRGLVLGGGAAAGDKIMAGERVVGDVLSVQGEMAMGLVRLDRWKSAAVSPTINEADVKIMGAPDGSE
ncbi:MAG: YgfZ/GcvT domain-containing protein [Maricaulaceae bacterium]